MKRIETQSRYDYKKLFDVSIDKNKLCFETVGTDEFGNLILHKSGTINMSSACSTYDEYYVLSNEEYSELVDKSRENKLISFWSRKKFLSQCSKPRESLGKIQSFESIKLHLSGMRITTDYEIIMSGDNAEVSEYVMHYENGKEVPKLMRRALCSEETVLKLLNDCKVLSWDGFYGAHPKGVLDGTMFRFEAILNNGKKVYANGSQNFPRHFRDFEHSLYEILYKEENT